MLSFLLIEEICSLWNFAGPKSMVIVTHSNPGRCEQPTKILTPPLFKQKKH
jgi:hypothetical protein